MSVDWQMFQRMKNPSELTLSLDSNPTPITGRIIDNEGMPVIDASLKITSIGRVLDRRNDGSTTMDDLNLWLGSHPVASQFNIKTDGAGRFSIPGIGNKRSVSFVLSGEGIARELVNIPSPELVQTMNQGSATKGSAGPFVHVAQPGRTVVGTIIDGKTGQPIEGARIRSYAVNRSIGLATDLAFEKSISDSQGQFRLSNLPSSNYTSLLIHPPKDQPYFIQEVFVPQQDGFDDIKMDVELTRGIWIEGKVTDLVTDAAVMSNIYYYPKANNEFLEGLRIFRDRTGNPAHQTQSDGSYRIVGLPGPGAVAIKTREPYPPSAEVASLSEAERTEIIIAGVGEVTGLQTVSPENYDEKLTVDFTVSKGKSVRIKLTRRNGGSVDSAIAHRLRSATDWYQAIEESDLVAPNFIDNESRQILFHSPSQRLGATVNVTANVKQPLRVIMQPTAKVSGYLLDKNKQPIAGSPVSILAKSGTSLRDIVDPTYTDKSGRFIFDSIIPGGPYLVNASVPDGGGGTEVRLDGLEIHTDLNVRSSEWIELGKIQVGQEKRPELVRSAMDAQGNKVSGPLPLPSFYSGTVVNENGQPIEDADIQFRTWDPASIGESKRHAQARSDGNGHFQFAVDQKVIDSINGDDSITPSIIVAARRFGPLVMDAREIANSNQVQIQLTRANVIRGTLLDKNDTPIAGRMLKISQPVMVCRSEEIDRLLDRLRDKPDITAGLELLEFDYQIHPNAGVFEDESIVTDEDGQFSIRLFPKNSVIRFDPIAESSGDHPILIINRPMKNVRVQSDSSQQTPLMIYGSRAKIGGSQ